MINIAIDRDEGFQCKPIICDDDDDGNGNGNGNGNDNDDDDDDETDLIFSSL